MNENRYDEALYKVDDRFLVHLRENPKGCDYAVFEAASKEKLYDGMIPWTEIAASAIKSTLAAFRLLHHLP